MEGENELVEKITSYLINTGNDLKQIGEKYRNFQLQLIIISGATFSIYVALKSSIPSHIIKWGFVFLVISLIFGFLSIISYLAHNVFGSYFRMFDFEKIVFSNQSTSIKDKLKEIGYSKPAMYAEHLDPELSNARRKEAIAFTRNFMTSWTHDLSILFGLIQMICFLIASILLLIGVIKI